MTAIVEIKGLGKVYSNGGIETPVLRGVDLVIREGEFVALMGPSGSGKSTLMHVLGFLDHPTSGSYAFNGVESVGLSDDERTLRRREDVGFVFQAFHLLPKLTALENVMLPLAYRDTPGAKRRELAAQALAAVDLADRADFLPNQLSGGQKQRVAIARALVTNPRMIFADEPTGNLDSVASGNVLALLQELNRRGHTIVMVTHEPEAAAYASRIIRMRDGLIVE